MNLSPSTQINLFGLNNFFLELTNLFDQKKFPNKILLSGEKGSGKCTLAYHIINYILSKDEDFTYDKENFLINEQNKSFKLIQNRSNPNFNLIDISEDKKFIDINQIRDLISNMNKSSFNDKIRFVLIDNIEFLNKNSVNALLKILEEPNKNVHFILIHNNKKILPTLSSRCLNFKISLTHNQSIEIANSIFGENVLNKINQDLIHHYLTPGNFYNLIKFSENFEVDLTAITLKEFITVIIEQNYYKKDNAIKHMLYDFIELFFRNNNFSNLYSYFLKKIDDCKKFNLDEESLLMEFEAKVLNG
ncbi:MAG: DNA polymerase III [Pelagibacteraceae bacterium BACL5 MAG-121128-bin54]|jgi:DNA polymerase III subunit delta'|nr:MAG: DNA polymerase III [Pelagibacteraceae bacterium BACL5 MAG-121128-bin54]